MAKRLIESNRGSGRTIGGILTVLGNAISHPGTTCSFVDHYKDSKNTFYKSYALYIETLISKLGLKNIEVESCRNYLTIKSNHYGVNLYSDGR